MLIFANDIRWVLGHVCYKQATKQEYASGSRCMCIRTHTRTFAKHTHLPVQISPPAVHFSLPLWSLFMSPHVPPSKPLFSPPLPFCYISCISAFLLHFCLCVWFPFSFHTVLRVSYHIFHHVTVNKVKCSTPFFLHLFSSAPVASQELVFTSCLLHATSL